MTPRVSAIGGDLTAWFEETAADLTTPLLCLDLPSQLEVLVVEDDPLVLARLREVVVAAGYAVRTARGGAEALASLERHPASIVVTDLNMPGMDGLALCRRIRETPWPGYVYIVVLTVRDEEPDILAGLAAGVDDFLSKRTSAALFTARLRVARHVLALEYSLKQELEKKRHLAMTDVLTGAYNRRYFLRHLTHALNRLQRSGGTLALLLVDIDHFKPVNDTHGHVVGDYVLTTMAREVGKCLKRATDWFARLGGDEFAVVLEGTDPSGARACAERIRQAIAHTRVNTAAASVAITVSIGIADFASECGGPSLSLQRLVERADANLYASKMAGRNRVTSPASLPAGGPGSSGPRSSNAPKQPALSSVR